MNIKVAIVLIIFFCKTSFSQTKEWSTYDFDSIVTIDMPFEVYEIDTIQDNQKIYQIYSNSDSLEFRVQKLYLGKVYSNVETIALPHNENSLEKLYSEMIWVASEITQYDLHYSKPINKFNLRGHKLVFNNSKGLPVHEMNTFVVNKNIYSFSYINTNGLNEIEKNLFFDSIIFDSKSELKQYYSQPYFISKKALLIIFLFLLVSFFLRFKAKKKKSLN